MEKIMNKPTVINPQPIYWLIEGFIGKNRIQGRVKAKDRYEAIDRGFRAIHTRYPNSLVIVLSDKCRPML